MSGIDHDNMESNYNFETSNDQQYNQPYSETYFIMACNGLKIMKIPKTEFTTKLTINLRPNL